jgi:rod shape-determining protein MreD
LLPLSVFVALLLGLLPLPAMLLPLRPYWLALVVAYWVIEDPTASAWASPSRSGCWPTWCRQLLGEQALRLVVMAFILQRFRARCGSSRCRSRRWRSAAAAQRSHRRPRRSIALGEPPAVEFWCAPLLGMLLWAPVFVLLDGCARAAER